MFRAICINTVQTGPVQIFLLSRLSRQNYWRLKARFMNSEVNGISVDRTIIEAYTGKDRAQSEELAIQITTDFAERIRDLVDGFYIMTPFNRTSLVSRIISGLKKTGTVAE